MPVELNLNVANWDSGNGRVAIPILRSTDDELTRFLMRAREAAAELPPEPNLPPLEFEVDGRVLIVSRVTTGNRHDAEAIVTVAAHTP